MNTTLLAQFTSVQFSRSVVSDSLRPHEWQHARPPCQSPAPRVHSNSCPSSPWCHPAISSSVVPFSSCPQSLPASGSFRISQLFTWSGQCIGLSALASVLPMNTQYLTLHKWPIEVSPCYGCYSCEWQNVWVTSQANSPIWSHDKGKCISQFFLQLLLWNLLDQI